MSDAPSLSRLRWIRARLLGRADDVVGTALTAGVFSKLLGILIAVPVSLCVTLTTGGDATKDFSGQVRTIDSDWLEAALVVAPLLESLILLAVTWLVRRVLGLAEIPAALCAGLILVPLHGLAAFSLTVFPTFALQALIAMRWQARGRPIAACVVVAATHLVHNLLSIGLAAVLP
jgi:hypothetical protein